VHLDKFGYLKKECSKRTIEFSKTLLKFLLFVLKNLAKINRF